MGLNAWVNCNCYKTGKCLTPPPFPEMIVMSETGEINIKELNPLPLDANGDHDEEKYGLWWEQFAAPHADWRGSACEHEDMTFVRYRLGNISGIASLRMTLAKIVEFQQHRFPVLEHQIVYSGIHGGDFLLPKAVVRLKIELDWIAAHDKTFLNSDELLHLSHFLSKMYDLAESSQYTDNPCCFLISSTSAACPKSPAPTNTRRR